MNDSRNSGLSLSITNDLMYNASCWSDLSSLWMSVFCNWWTLAEQAFTRYSLSHSWWYRTFTSWKPISPIFANNLLSFKAYVFTLISMLSKSHLPKPASFRMNFFLTVHKKWNSFARIPLGLVVVDGWWPSLCSHQLVIITSCHVNAALISGQCYLLPWDLDWSNKELLGNISGYVPLFEMLHHKGIQGW